MKSLIVFAGAGASRGVSGEKYPMAVGFRQRLPESIRENKLYIYLNDFLTNYQHEEIDIEHILWELGELNNATAPWSSGKSFAEKLLTSNQIQTIFSSSAPGLNIHNSMFHLRNEVTNLQNQINERVYDFYSQEPTAEELNHSWLPLFDLINDATFEKIDIFTTNYDLVIESALVSYPSLSVEMGYSKGPLNPVISLNEWRSIETKNGMLTKLHGSVDWKRGNGGTEVDPVIRRGHPEFDGDHGKRLILYPGFKGVPSQEPFITFHDYFRRKLTTASHVLFIGFAFRDEYINDLIKSSIPKGNKVAVINPAQKLPDLPFLNNATHLPHNFGDIKKGTLLTDAGKSPVDLQALRKWLLS